MIKLTSIKLNDGTHGLPKNPRLIKDERFKSLCASIENNPEYMPARPIVVDENGVILGGNMRWRACRELGMKEIPAAWVKRVEGWTLEKKRRFIILDNRLWGEDDWDELANEWEEDELQAAGFEEIVPAAKNPYTRKIEAPLYEPTGKKPALSDLCDIEKYEEILASIEAAEKIPNEIKHFLRLAASRHIVFHYGNIAEFYAHSDKYIQSHLEQSALVLIDLKAAIENGFVKLTERVMELYAECAGAGE